MTEKMHVVSSEDYGRDEQSAMVSLLVKDCCSTFVPKQRLSIV